ncbi:MAG: 2-oxoacid:acceptor oxidoreductase subunit alpha [Erysipelotrichaceae bacterium]|nr:2-oxoacid:acceptor oxidoreductase subunit alpha [Erysipelotrichaceae bacterium]
MSKAVLMQGNEACVKGALKAGMRFFAGYPITPSTEIAEGCAVELPKLGGKFIQMEDELASMAAVIGASVTGTKAMTATSGPGFSLKQENIGYACEAEIPCVIVDVQRSGPSTGLPTSSSQGDVMQTRWGTHGDHPIIVLSPSSVSETYYLTIRAFNLAEKYMTPVILLMDEMIGHLRETVNLYDDVEIINRKQPDEPEGNFEAYKAGENLVPVLPVFGSGHYYNITGLTHNTWGFPTNNRKIAGDLNSRLLNKIEKNRKDIESFEEYLCDDAELLIVAYGGSARVGEESVDMLRKKGIKAGMYRPVTIWPMAETRLAELSERTGKVLVIEHNNGQYVHEVERVAGKKVEVGFIGNISGSYILPTEVVKKAEEMYYAK